MGKKDGKLCNIYFLRG